MLRVFSDAIDALITRFRQQLFEDLQVSMHFFRVCRITKKLFVKRERVKFVFRKSVGNLIKIDVTGHKTKTEQLEIFDSTETHWKFSIVIHE